MKKLVISLALVLFVVTTNAQLNLSLNFNGTKGILGLMGTEVSGSYTIGEKGYYENIKYGTGFNPEFRVGYCFSDNFEVGCRFGYLISKNAVIVSTNSDDESNINYRYMDARSTSMQLIPDFRYKTEKGFYGGFGLILNLMQKSVGKDYSNQYIFSQVIPIRAEYSQTGKFGFGGKFFTGYEYEINDHLCIQGEINCTLLQLIASKKEYTTYLFNGTEMINTLDYSNTHFEYVNSVTWQSSLDKNSATQMPIDNISRMSFSSIGINLGIKYKF